LSLRAFASANRSNPFLSQPSTHCESASGGRDNLTGQPHYYAVCHSRPDRESITGIFGCLVQQETINCLSEPALGRAKNPEEGNNVLVVKGRLGAA
jgi:hypothetical protein